MAKRRLPAEQDEMRRDRQQIGIDANTDEMILRLCRDYDLAKSDVVRRLATFAVRAPDMVQHAILFRRVPADVAKIMADQVQQYLQTMVVQPEAPNVAVLHRTPNQFPQRSGGACV